MMSNDLDLGSAASAGASQREREAARVRTVALLGPYASRNLGDTATQRSVIENLRLRQPELRFVGISPEPDDTLQSLGVTAFPLSGRGQASGSLVGENTAALPAEPVRRLDGLRVMRRIDRFVRSLDLLLISGGGQLDDFWGGAWGHPWAMLQWSALARRHGVPVAFLGVGLDRLSGGLSRRLALWALGLASYRAFRDEGTQRAMQRMGLRARSHVCPDLAFGLQGLDVRPADAGRRRFAVINPISSRTWSHAAGDDQSDYLHQLEEIGAWMAARGLALRIACTQASMDGALAHRLASLLKARQVDDVEVFDESSVDGYLAQVRGAEVVVAARLHGVILALAAGSPVVALSPLPKVEQVMADVGLAHLCLPLPGFSTQQLIACTAQALASTAALRRQIAALNVRYRACLERTFDDVLMLLR